MMKRNTGGSRKIMSDRATKEYFLSVLDDAVSSIENDKMGEWHERWGYTLEEKKEESFVDDISSCHKCSACFRRRVYAEGIINKNPKILFVLPYPEGDTILLPPSYSYFTKWVNAMGLESADVALSALIKCPVSSFDTSAADSCRGYLKDEMALLKPSSIVLLGKDVASYMLRRSSNYDEMRQHQYKINGIKTFTTYSPLELVNDRALRAKIWEDLKFISSSIEKGV